MFIVKNKWVFLGISIFLIVASLFLVFTKGIKKGIDFTGGTDVVVAYNAYTTKEDGSIDLDFIKQNLEDNGFSVKDIFLKEMNASGTALVNIKLAGDLSNEQRANFENAWSFNHDPHYEAKQISENIIGPSVGKELTKKAIWSIALVVLIIILFVAYSFRQVSKPISSWKYGLITVTSLLHDITIPLGMYAILGQTHGAEIDSLFILALLTIMGISISDTIVVFDRIRENLKLKKGGETFEETVGKSLDQTIVRSLNTSLAVMIVLLALYLFGPISIKDFTLTLLVGVFFGTYSSIFVASPLLVLVEKWQRKKK